MSDVSTPISVGSVPESWLSRSRRSTTSSLLHPTWYQLHTETELSCHLLLVCHFEPCVEVYNAFKASTASCDTAPSSRCDRSFLSIGGTGASLSCLEFLINNPSRIQARWTCLNHRHRNSYLWGLKFVSREQHASIFAPLLINHLI